MVSGPTSRIISSNGTLWMETIAVVHILGERVGDDRIDGQNDLAALLFGFRHDLARRRMKVGLGERLPGHRPVDCRNVLAMPPPMISLSTLATRLVSTSILVETFMPPTTAATGR